MKTKLRGTLVAGVLGAGLGLALGAMVQPTAALAQAKSITIGINLPLTGADAESATAPWHPARCAGFAIVFDIAAGTEIIRAHLSFSNRVPLELQAAADFYYRSHQTAMKGYFCQK